MKGKRIFKGKTTKDIFSNVENWKLNRRKFVKALSVTTILSQIAMVSSCVETKPKVYKANTYLTALEAEIIQKIQNVLFPDDGNGPSVIDINAYAHFLWVLSDKRKDPESIEYIINGLGWTEDASQENYGRTFSDLTHLEVEELVAFMADRNWGASWLSIIITLIFEALSMDPIYGVNTNEVGWKWLEHHHGTPRPNKGNSYTNIFNTINAN
jgi:gluconate 2-dehydrogenase gamma chain